MNEANTADESTDSMDVLVTAAGLVGADRYVKDYGEIAKRVDNSLTGLEAMLGKSIDTVYTRGSPELQNELEIVLEQDVESSFFYWTDFLNDEAVIEDGTEVVPAVREEGQPKIDTSSKEAIPFGEIDEARERRAKAKAAAKNNHYLFSEYFEDYPMVEALVNVNCGSHRGLAQIRDLEVTTSGSTDAPATFARRSTLTSKTRSSTAGT